MNKKKIIIAVSAAVAVFAVAAVAFVISRKQKNEIEIVPDVTTAVSTAPETQPETEPVTTFAPFVNGLSLKAQ